MREVARVYRRCKRVEDHEDHDDTFDRSKEDKIRCKGSRGVQEITRVKGSRRSEGHIGMIEEMQLSLSY